jgi:predicted protein tyrosine phosphatase
MKRFLFVCGRNRRRSPTAEQIFSHDPHIEIESAGLSPDADNPVTPDLVEWAQIIFVMEQSQRRKLTQRFRPHLKGARIVCLDIPDRVDFMDAELVRILKAKVSPFLV